MLLKVIEGGLLQLLEKSWHGKDNTCNAYQSLALKQKGSGALAGDSTLPVAIPAEEKKHEGIEIDTGIKSI